MIDFNEKPENHTGNTDGGASDPLEGNGGEKTRFEGQIIAGLWPRRNGAKGLAGRMELNVSIIIPAGSTFAILPRKNVVENGPTYNLMMFPPKDARSTDDIPF